MGRADLKNSSSNWPRSMPCCLARSETKVATPSDSVGPGRTELTVTPVPAVVSATPRAIASWAVLVMP